MSKNIDDFTDCFMSLVDAVQDAGGRVHFWEVRQMSAVDLIKLICTNNIRFTYIKPKMEK